MFNHAQLWAVGLTETTHTALYQPIIYAYYKTIFGIHFLISHYLFFLYSFWYSQSQPKRRSAAIKIINPDTNTEIDLSSTQSTSSGMSSASSSTTRLSDHADTLGQSSDKENLVAKEFRERVLSSLKPAHNAIIKSPTETKGPVSTVDQSLDTPSLEHVADEVDVMSEPDRSAEQPTDTLPPEVIQSNEGD